MDLSTLYSFSIIHQGNIRWIQNTDTSGSTIVTVRKSAPNQLDLGNIDVKVEVDDNNKVIKVTSDVIGHVGDSAGSRARLASLLPVLLAPWWGNTRHEALLGTVATLLLLLCYTGTSADTQNAARADVTIATPT